MSNKKTNKNIKKKYKSWIFFSTNEEDTNIVVQKIDQILSNELCYSIYPHNEFSQEYFSPYEASEIYCAWQHPQAKSYAFLTTNPFLDRSNYLKNLLLEIVGENIAVESIENKINVLKRKLNKNAFDLYEKNLLERKGEKSKNNISIKSLFTIFGAFTIGINALNLYLVKLPQPNGKVASKLVIILISLIHVSSLLMLLLFIILSGLYMLKIGYGIINRRI